MDSLKPDTPPVNKAAFLRDVIALAFTAFGGPQAHIAIMIDLLVEKRKYLTEAELIELNALCQILPGPTSTQTMTSIGYKHGGPALALITLMLWAMPGILAMTTLSFLYSFLRNHNISTEFLRFISPLAVGMVAVAAFKIGKKVVTDSATIVLFAIAAVIACFFRQPWVFPLILLAGGLVTLLLSRSGIQKEHVKLKAPWGYLIAFLSFFAIAEGLFLLYPVRHVQLFESFYRYGSLIFGGGQVLIPFMQGDLVETKHFLTNQEFLTGFGLVQAVPGPLFSFSAYAGGMSVSGTTILGQLAACVISATAIFLPGTLLIFFVYPIWQDLKKLSVIKLALKGVNATAAGLVAAAAWVLLCSIGFSVENILTVLATFGVLSFTKISAPWLVVAALLLGIGFMFW